MAATLRLCVLVEVTARHRHLWHHTTLPQVVEPLLAYLQAAIGVELALVLFGAHPPHSLAAAESPLGWCRGEGHFRRQLLDGGSLECAGGGGQPVALAEALLEAAALFTLPGGGSTCQQHCLVCLASEPAVQPVAWPFFQDCSMVSGPVTGTGWAGGCPGWQQLLHANGAVRHCSMHAHPFGLSTARPPAPGPCLPRPCPRPAGQAAGACHFHRAVPRPAPPRHPAGRGGGQPVCQLSHLLAPGKHPVGQAPQVRLCAHAPLPTSPAHCVCVEGSHSGHAAILRHLLQLLRSQFDNKTHTLPACLPARLALPPCCSLAESRVPHLRQHQEATLQRLMRTAVTLPGGGGMAVLPSWPEALEVGGWVGSKGHGLWPALLLMDCLNHFKPCPGSWHV